MPTDALLSPAMEREKDRGEALSRVEKVRRSLPAEGLFHEKEWRISPDPFPLSPSTVLDLERLGGVLHRFQRTANLIYRRSAKGSLPGWIADDLDRGKPSDLIEHGRQGPLADTIPGVIRPDVILTEKGFSITELDSVPGGIGLTGWLNQTWSDMGYENILGGRQGMTDGFASLFPEGADIVVSEEAGDYRPEMHWLKGQLPEDRPWEVQSAESYAPTGRDVYRFFELFDLKNVPFAREMLSGRGAQPSLNAPMKPWMEEKMWLALFWSAPLRSIWQRELRHSHWQWLQQHIPFGWAVDPAPIPHHAVLPRLGLNSFSEMEGFSQTERDMVLKVSGFADDAWGGKGVYIGSDLSQSEWKRVVRMAMTDFEQRPWVLQEFHRGRIVHHRWWDPEAGEMKVMRGRVRLCPYYFIPSGEVRPVPKLGGVLATICPEDKKKLHGMSEAIIVPCEVSEAGY